MEKPNINISWVIFIIGLVPLAFANEYFKHELGDLWVRVIIAVIYLVILRLAGDLIASKIQQKT